MAWEQCVSSIHQNLDPNGKEINQVIWTGSGAMVTQNQLDDDTFAKGKPFTLICPDRHCADYADFSPQAHVLCSCKDINGNPIPDCVPKNYLYPYRSYVCLDIDNPKDYSSKRSRACTRQGDSFYQLTCYCCCSCYANGTKIAIPTGVRAIEYFAVGDEVMAASLDKGKITWSPRKVTFSQGTGDSGHQSAMVYLHYGEDDKQIIVSTDQVFLMSAGKLKRADVLVPGKDLLVDEWGNPVVIHEVSIGEYDGGVHHISTGINKSGDINGHLLLSEGVISGDFSVQINSQGLMEQGIMEDHKDLPKIGTEEYEKSNLHLSEEVYNVAQSTAVTENHKSDVKRLAKFYVHGERLTQIPETAAAYFDKAQAEDIKKNAPQWGFGEIGINSAMVKYVIKLFKGFYPNIEFYYDQANKNVNAYAFEQMSTPTIIITGGLTRVKSLGQEGISLILAHMISAVQKLTPPGANGWTSVGMADYYSVSVLMNVYFGSYYTTVYRTGIKQLQKHLFEFINSKDDKYTNDPYKPTIDIRFDCLDAGNGMDFPPPGVGGPVLGGLKVEKASVIPPMVGLRSFMNISINDERSAIVLQELQNADIVDENGIISKRFNINTDLSFLFADVKDRDQREMLINSVRYTLIHAPGLIELQFNNLLNIGSASSALDYYLSPEVTIVSAQAKEGIPIVEIRANIKRDTEYTLTVSSYVRSNIGSTLDREKNNVTFKVS